MPIPPRLGPLKTTMQNTTKIIGGIAVLALILSGIAFFRHGTTQTIIEQQSSDQSQTQSQPSSQNFGAVSNTNGPAANTVLVNGQLLSNPSVLDYVIARQLLYTDGAIAFGNSTSSTPILQQGARQPIIASSSVICSLASPFTTATSSYEFGWTISSTSANAVTFVLASSTANNTGATTTVQATVSLAANTQNSFSTQGSTTAATNGANMSGIVGPGQRLNLGALTGGSAALLQFGGACNAIFTSLN